MNAVTTQTSEYELVLMLDPEAPDERRDQIAADALQRIEAGGTLKHDRAWGMRKLAYEIRQRTEADYRFFRFESESPLLEELDHNLKITDGVLRFRVFKVDPDSPLIEPPPPVSLAGSAPSRGPAGRRGSDDRPPRGRTPEGEAPSQPAPASDAPAESPEQAPAASGAGAPAAAPAAEPADVVPAEAPAAEPPPAEQAPEGEPAPESAPAEPAGESPEAESPEAEPASSEGDEPPARQ